MLHHTGATVAIGCRRHWPLSGAGPFADATAMPDPLSLQLDRYHDLGELVNACHDYLTRLLDWHQQALVERDAGLALGFWRLHEALLRLHVELEDAHLLATHAQVVERPAWPAAIYLAEHRKVLGMASAIGGELLDAAGGGLHRREVIALLDRQRSFKNLLEHHESREEQAMLPELAVALPGPAGVALGRPCRERWGELIGAQRQPLAALLAVLQSYPDGSAEGD